MSGLLDAAAVSGPKWAANTNVVTPGSSTTTALSQNTLRLVPIVVPNTVRVTGITVETTVIGDAGALARLGIWASDAQGVYPSTLLTPATGTAVAADAVGFATAAVNVLLQPGTYWVGALVENTATAPTFRTSTTLQYPQSTTQVNSTGGGGYSLGAQTPGSLGNLTGPPFGGTATSFKFNLTIGTP